MTTPAEEPVDPTTNEEVVDPPVVEPETTTEEVAPTDLWSLLTGEFADGTADPALDDVAKGITADTIKSADPEIRAMLRAVLRKSEENAKAAAEAHTARLKELDDREAKIKAEDAKVNQRRAALNKMASTVAKDPGPAPTKDPFTAEGIAERAAFEARKALADSWAPVATEVNKEMAEQKRNETWNTMLTKHPDFAKPGVVDAYDKFYDAYHATHGIDLAKNPDRAMPPAMIADLFMADRASAALQADTAKRSREAAALRATSARTIGRGHGGGLNSPLQRVLAVEATGDAKALYAILSSDPDAAAAYNKHTNA